MTTTQILDTPILTADRTHDSLTRKLDTGMTVGEAIDSAMLWWENKGRRLMRDRNEATDNPGHGAFTPNPKSEAEALNSYPSGIMHGVPWADLTREEKLQVTRHWHNCHVRIAGA
jgi:hypothetical protein